MKLYSTGVRFETHHTRKTRVKTYKHTTISYVCTYHNESKVYPYASTCQITRQQKAAR